MQKTQRKKPRKSSEKNSLFTEGKLPELKSRTRKVGYGAMECLDKLITGYLPRRGLRVLHQHFGLCCYNIFTERYLKVIFQAEV